MTDPAQPLSGPPPVIPAERLPVSRKRWAIHLFLMAAYPLAIGALSWRRTGTGGAMLSGSALDLLFVCGQELLLFGAVFGLAWLASRASKDDLLLRWRMGFWPLPLGAAYSIGLRAALSFVLIAIGVALIVTRLATAESLKDFLTHNRPQIEAIIDVSAMRDNPVFYWLAVTVVSFVLGGLREELWRSAFLGGMRTLWPQRFGSRAGQLAAVAVAAVLFGFGHMPQGIFMVGVATLLGFGLGVIMVLHRSIWPAVIAHGFFDATSLALLPWVMDKLPGVGH